MWACGSVAPHRRPRKLHYGAEVDRHGGCLRTSCGCLCGTEACAGRTTLSVAANFNPSPPLLIFVPPLAITGMQSHAQYHDSKSANQHHQKSPGLTPVDPPWACFLATALHIAQPCPSAGMLANPTIPNNAIPKQLLRHEFCFAETSSRFLKPLSKRPNAKYAPASGKKEEIHNHKNTQSQRSPASSASKLSQTSNA